MTCCPRCDIELERIANEQAWICRQCDGVLLRKLDPYLDMTEDELRQSGVSESLFADHPQINLDRPVACPLCSRIMRRYIYSADSGVLIDSCLSGHGIWLDDGELARIYDYLHSIEPLDHGVELTREEKATAVMREFGKRAK